MSVLSIVYIWAPTRNDIILISYIPNYQFQVDIWELNICSVYNKVNW